MGVNLNLEILLFSKTIPDSDEALSVPNLFAFMRIINIIKVWISKLHDILNMLKVGICDLLLIVESNSK